MAEKEYTDTEICMKCVDENEILFDESSKYVEEIFSILFDCSENLYHDMMRNLTGCKDILLMSLKQRIIMNESRVRFFARNDIAGLQAKIADINLDKECKNYLRDISSHGYKILKENHLCANLVEFDAEQSAKICIFGRKGNMIGKPDLLALIDKQLGKKAPKNSTKNVYKNCFKVVDRATNSKTEDKAKDADRETDSKTKDIDQVSETEKDMGSLRKVAVTVAVTARNYVSVSDIFRQLLFMYLLDISQFFLLVYHIGPLVETQKVVLYEYLPPKDIVKLVKSFQGIDRTGKCEQEIKINPKTDEFVVSQTVQKSFVLGPPELLEDHTRSHGLDVSQLETEFRKVKGKHLQQSSPLKDYFWYMVHDCPGVKDHQRDNKARFDRYIAKCERKKELRKAARASRQTKETNGEDDPEGTVVTNNAVLGSVGISNNL